MRRIILVAALVAGTTGCGSGSAVSTGAARPADPTIHYREEVGGDLGPVGGRRNREYQGPVSEAPDWAKSQSGKKK